MCCWLFFLTHSCLLCTGEPPDRHLSSIVIFHMRFSFLREILNAVFSLVAIRWWRRSFAGIYSHKKLSILTEFLNLSIRCWTLCTDIFIKQPYQPPKPKFNEEPVKKKNQAYLCVCDPKKNLDQTGLNMFCLKVNLTLLTQKRPYHSPPMYSQMYMN